MYVEWNHQLRNGANKMYNDYDEEDNDASLLNNDYCDEVERQAQAQIDSDAEDALTY